MSVTSNNWMGQFNTEILRCLILDRTTRRNILWGTDEYIHKGYKASDEISISVLAGFLGDIIQPRILKSSRLQQERTRKKGEVFTPSWICNKQNNIVDEAWFGKENVFNIALGKEWKTKTNIILFPTKKSRTWKKYIDSKRLEIACGEAPYLVSRYESVTGEPIVFIDRIGLLDRKIRIVNENTTDVDTWYTWIIRAYQSIYGYDVQGDNVIIARMNLLLTFIEAMEYRWQRKPTVQEVKKIARIISWNIWQMDAFTLSIPEQKYEVVKCYMNLFSSENETVSATTIPCKIMDWRRDRSIPVESLKEIYWKGRHAMKFDVIIGNPPYQEETAKKETKNGQKAVKNIFQYFQMEADKICKGSIVLIYPGGRWIHQSGKGLKKFGLEQINDPHLKEIIFYPNATEVFTEPGISDGISIVYKNMNKNSKQGGVLYIYSEHGIEQTFHVQYPGENLLPLNPNNISIIEKIRSFISHNHLKYLHESILSRSLFGIESNAVEEHPNLFRLWTPDTPFVSSDEIKVFTNDHAGKTGRARWFIVKW